MLSTISPAQMRALEAEFMHAHGVPGALLMEHAAQGVFRAARRLAGGGTRALFLCGPGNNGGDGYAAARLWAASGRKAQILEMTNVLQGDAAMNRTLALLSGVSIRTLSDAPDALPEADVIVDALYGTGLNRNLSGLALALIRLINRADAPVAAVDIPSGLDGLTGRALPEAVHAAETVTFHLPKPGLMLRSGPQHTGRLSVQPILIPPSSAPVDGLRLLDLGDMTKLIPPRAAVSHKGTFGRVVIFAGSTGMAGAAAFAAQACVRSGAGLTTVLCRRNVLPVVQTLAPGATCVLLPEENDRLLPESAAVAGQYLARASSAACGCGLGQGEDLLPVLHAFRQAACPVVWDADALNLIARTPDLLPLKAQDIVTPHPGEAASLLHLTAAEVTDEPLEALSGLHAMLGCHVLLKGARTLMTDGDQTAVNAWGSPALAKGGSGDVLTGVLAAMLAQLPGLDTLEKMQLAAMVHGLAGLRAGAACGEACSTPETLISCLRLDAGLLPAGCTPLTMAPADPIIA